MILERGENVVEMQAFSADQVRALTGLSDRQLRYWDDTGFFSPRYAEDQHYRSRQRLYSFQDLVGLRTIALLRNEHHISLQELRQVGEWLKEHHASPWSSLTFYVMGRHVVFDDPVTGERIAGQPFGQIALPIEMERIAQTVRGDVDQLRRRRPEQVGQVDRKRQVVSNAAVLRGTRITTSAIRAFYQAEYPIEAILAEYPQLTPDDIQAAIDYEESRRSTRTA